ncbi:MULTISPECIES: glycosyl hydrolase 108 family protein [unclassified Azospirillum]|uniref:glycosyl hydrolase 108 family protein n=1 Tax=unclassified Azospirillum TaxID=2630922 RepID=UPI000B679F72|nr:MULTISPECIES: glycosyl hydrolase 108 family protein [unclassified Azospirillum]SNS57263.1 Putative peptidoglycan binding domain-containing protein [Azospirillum sp. RU38E]SNS77043.1 Putative peptidoglycan binding domain-containing protein [Azospirillum sp. RU37A]
MSESFNLFNRLSSTFRDVKDFVDRNVEGFLGDDEEEADTPPAADPAPPPVDYRSLFNDEPEKVPVYGSPPAGTQYMVRHPTLVEEADDPRFPAFQQAWREGKPVEDLLGDTPFGLKAKVASNGGDNWRPDVAKVQVLLNKAGYHDVIPEDGPSGYHSTKLDQDVRRFQRDNKLRVDGKLSPGGETIQALEKLLAQKPKPAPASAGQDAATIQPTNKAPTPPAASGGTTAPTSSDPSRPDQPPPVKLAPGRRLFKEPDWKSEAMFEELVKNIFEKEAGYSNHEYDKGGETNYGITERTLKSYQIMHGGMGKDGSFVEPKNLSRDQAKEIYRNEFFYGQRVNEISDLGVASALIDSFVLHGPKYGWQLFQKSANAIDKENNLVEDGNGGSKTILKINKIPQNQISNLLEQNYTDRLDFVSKNAENNKKQKVFEKGWINRLGWVNEKSKELSRKKYIS